VKDDRTLDALLGALREATDEEAPAPLEERLRRHLAAQTARVPRRSLAPWLAAAASVALVAAAVLAAWPRGTAVPPRVAAAATPAAESTQAIAPPPAPPRREAPPAAPVRPRRPLRRTAPATVPPASVPAEEPRFVALPGAPGLRDADSLHLVRVSVPPTALAAWGWPTRDAGPEPVQAEVIVGHDGLARAIRFVDAEAWRGPGHMRPRRRE
jgi:hypothetical protein